MKNLILPEGVYRHGKKFRMRVYVEPDNRARWHYFRAKNYMDFFKEWESYVQQKKAVTMNGVFDRYQAQEIPKKADDTAKSDIKALKFLRRAFGNICPDEVRSSQIVAYIDARGKAAPVRANREVDLLSHVFTKCRHWELVEHNPAQKLRYRNPEAPRRRYVTDLELWRALRIAPPMIRYAIFMAVLTGLRRRDILSLKWSDFGRDGLTVTLSKSRRAGRSPKRLLFEWSRSLRRLYVRIAAMGGHINSIALNCDAFDNFLEKQSMRKSRIFNISESSYGNKWSGFQGLVVDAGIPRFQMKDLRAKYATDLDERGGNATRALAHSSSATTQRHYQRKPTRITKE